MTRNAHDTVRQAIQAMRADRHPTDDALLIPGGLIEVMLDEYDRARAVADKAATLANGAVEQAVPLVLGWSNTGPLSLCLYARDVDSPRWWQRGLHENGRRAEYALTERGDHEGTRYLLVQVEP